MLFYSLSEFAYLLLFISIGTGVALTTAYLNSQMVINEKEKEIQILNELLADKKYGVVPCWKRPEEKVPEIAGTLTIHNKRKMTLTHHSGISEEILLSGESVEEPLAASVSRLFYEDHKYSLEKNCYLRFSIINETNSYALFQKVSSGLAALGMVVVDE